MSRFAPKHVKSLLLLSLLAGSTSFRALAQTAQESAAQQVDAASQAVSESSSQDSPGQQVVAVPQAVSESSVGGSNATAETLHDAAPQTVSEGSSQDSPAQQVVAVPQSVSETSMGGSKTVAETQRVQAAPQSDIPRPTAAAPVAVSGQQPVAQANPVSKTNEPRAPQAANKQIAPADKKHAPTPPPPFHISSRFSRSVQKYTGLTMVSDFIASQAADRVLSKKLHGKVKVKVKSYSLTDLIAGKVKSVRIKTAGGAYKDVPVGSLELASETPIWYQYHSKNGEKAGLKTPILLDVKAQLDNKTVVQALESQKIAQSLHGLKLDLPGLGEQQLQVVHPKVDFSENAIRIDATLITVGGAEDSGVPIVISGTPELKGDKIFITGMKVESPFIMEPEKFAAFASELLNPIFDFSKLDRKDHAFRLKELAVKEDSVQGDGQLLIAPRVQSQIAAKNSNSVSH